MKRNTPSRTQRRAGKKALVCPHCVRAVAGNNGRNLGRFQGKGGARLANHIREVHQNPRTNRPVIL